MEHPHKDAEACIFPETDLRRPFDMKPMRHWQIGGHTESPFADEKSDYENKTGIPVFLESTRHFDETPVKPTRRLLFKAGLQLLSEAREALRHEKDNADDEHAVDRTGQTLGDIFRQVGDE